MLVGCTTLLKHSIISRHAIIGASKTASCLGRSSYTCQLMPLKLLRGFYLHAFGKNIFAWCVPYPTMQPAGARRTPNSGMWPNSELNISGTTANIAHPIEELRETWLLLTILSYVAKPNSHGIMVWWLCPPHIPSFPSPRPPSWRNVWNSETFLWERARSALINSISNPKPIISGSCSWIFRQDHGVSELHSHFWSKAIETNISVMEKTTFRDFFCKNQYRG
jgi:hypothetical protein